MPSLWSAAAPNRCRSRCLQSARETSVISLRGRTLLFDLIFSSGLSWLGGPAAATAAAFGSAVGGETLSDREKRLRGVGGRHTGGKTHVSEGKHVVPRGRLRSPCSNYRLPSMLMAPNHSGRSISLVGCLNSPCRNCRLPPMVMPPQSAASLRVSLQAV